MDIKYCVEVAEFYYKEGNKSYRFKQKYLGEENDLEPLKQIVNKLKEVDLKARIIDFTNCKEVYKNYNSVIWG